MTVEAAFAVATIVAVLVLCAAAVATLVLNIRCIDAAREVARVAARSATTDDDISWEPALPAGARASVRFDGDWAVARVEADAPLPTIRIVAEATVLIEEAAAELPPPTVIEAPADPATPSGEAGP